MRPTVACILALCVALVALQLSAARTVSIAVDAPWSQHPAAYILELAEFTADQGSDVYWRYLDALCTSHGAAIDAVASPKQCPFLGMGAFEAPVAHAAAYSAAAALVSAPMHPLMETMVGVGFYGPAVQVRAMPSRFRLLPHFLSEAAHIPPILLTLSAVSHLAGRALRRGVPRGRRLRRHVPRGPRGVRC